MQTYKKKKKTENNQNSFYITKVNLHRNILQNWFGFMAFNHCRLFNAKSIVIHIKSSISINLIEHEYTI